MLKKDLFSDKIYLSNILRNMLASGIGFLIVWILCIFFEDHTTEENIIISGFLIFMLFAGLFFYSSIVENFLYIVMKRKRILPFLVTHISLIAIVFLAHIYFGSEFFLEATIVLLVFVLLQTIGFLYQRRRNLNQ